MLWGWDHPLHFHISTLFFNNPRIVISHSLRGSSGICLYLSKLEHTLDHFLYQILTGSFKSNQSSFLLNTERPLLQYQPLACFPCRITDQHCTKGCATTEELWVLMWSPPCNTIPLHQPFQRPQLNMHSSSEISPRDRGGISTKLAALQRPWNRFFSHFLQCKTREISFIFRRV